MKRNWAWVAAVAATLGLAGCGDDNNGGTTTPPPACTPPATPTARFSTAVHPILTSKCGTCHGTTWGSADTATSYTAAAARVNTAAPAQSTLLVKGTGGASHAGGVALDPEQAATVTTWITECAQNN